MKIHIEICEAQLKNLIIELLKDRFQTGFLPDSLRIEVKSKQNYKSEWEEASYRAIYDGEL